MGRQPRPPDLLCVVHRSPAAGLWAADRWMRKGSGVIFENDQRKITPDPVSDYFEYNSTISCSCTGRLICSRVGTEPIFADSAAGSNCSHSGTPRPFTSSRACRIAGDFWLLCLTATTSPGLTE